jgi:hypothetical protein
MSDLISQIAAVLRLHGDHDTRANAAYLAQRVAEAVPELAEVQKLLAVWTEGLVTDKEAYWRLREIMRPKESNDDRIMRPKMEKP